MKTYDWIVIGGGITGAALSYELAKKGFSVLLLEQSTTPGNATRYSYGGLAYWSATTELTRQLCHEGIERNRILAAELDIDTQFKILDLILTIDPDDNLEELARFYSQCVIPPKLISVQEACRMEPLLNPQNIAGAFTVKHGHINQELVTQGYIQAMIRLKGEMQIAKVLDLIKEGDRISGVNTTTATYYSSNIAVCAGGFSRQLLTKSGIPVRLYFTHTALIEISSPNIHLNSLVMPARIKRLQLEATSSKSELESLWNQPENEPIPAIIDSGAVQFQDGTIKLGQISRVITDPNAKIDLKHSENTIRTQVGKILPALANLPGTCHHCLVAFSYNQLPVIGKIPGIEGISIFSGFSNPLVFVPPLAQRFANFAAGQNEPIINQLLPSLQL